MGCYPSERLLNMWVDLRASEIPDECVGREIDGIDLMGLDALAVGCISAYVGNACELDERRRRLLKTTTEQLRLVTPQLSGEARVYFTKVRQTAQLVLEELFRTQ